MNSQELKEMYQDYVAPTYGRFDLAIASGKGVRCKDFEGKEYLDFTSGIGVNSLGLCDEGWSAAVANQAAALNHTSNLYYTQPGGLLAKLLCENSGMKKAFFSNSGAEANEGVIKTARKYSRDRYGEGREKILTLVNSFHGRTIATLKATGQEVFHQNFMPFPDGFDYVEANNLEDLAAKIDSSTCAVMVEMVQGEGGVIPLDHAFVHAIQANCQQKDLLFIVDEVQTGICRTGSLFAYQQFGLHPDLVSFAKGIGGGLPLGGFLLGEKTKDVLGKGDHATTFGANPICCAGALEVMKRLCNPEGLSSISQKGEYLRSKLLSLPHIAGVDGMGMMLGASLEGIAAGQVVARCIQEGLLLLTAKTKLRFLPPLIISYEEIDEGLDMLERVLKSFS